MWLATTSVTNVTMTNAEHSDVLLYEAWCVIANAGWDDQSDEWREAAMRWRDKWMVMMREEEINGT